ncbi:MULTISPECIES: hypothetical protein [unclassified Cryobacterium]|uniref:hypothetical protein n=1 Tax=unclassified Cryobacterium TaxID=2649013 RepID=UPI00106C20F3|nr:MULTISPECIES: hypothetical protein [unclassified Cryobacterium]TFD09253.1 hypothetical protein E3T29_03560 [Cryobacterium sp. TMT1-66-1]TFD14939.1 hypothetical protein E3T35_00675 [Cryobacterium sp. TMT1-2-2]
MGSFLSPTTATALVHLLNLQPDAAPLERLRAIRALQAALEHDPATLAAVRDAVAADTSWDEIADATGLKAPAAKWRWGGTDDEISARLEAGRKRSVRPSSVPTDLPGLSVAEAAAARGVSAQAIYLQVRRGTLVSRTVTLPDGRSYKRVFPAGTPDLESSPDSRPDINGDVPL